MTLRTIHPATRNPADHAWLAAFLKQLRREDLSPMTVRGYQSDLRLFLRWYASPALEKLTAVDIMNYRRHLSGGGLKPASINRKLEGAAPALPLGAPRGKTCRQSRLRSKAGADHARSAARGSDRIGGYRAASCRRPVPARAEQAQLRPAAGAAANRARVSDAAALRVGDVVLRERAGSVKVHGKGGKERQLPLNSSARRGLSAYLETRQPLRPDDPLITSETGAAISVRSIQSVIRELARRAKITRLPVTAHSLRHTFALHYLERNPGKLVELAALLGHESLDTTAVYLRPSQEEMAQGVERSRLNAAE